MFFRALNQGHVSLICPSSFLCVKFCHNVEVPSGGVEVVPPDFDSEHKVFLRVGLQCEESGVGALFGLEGGGEGVPLEGVHDHVGESNNDDNDDADGEDAPCEGPVLAFLLEPEELGGVEEVVHLDEVLEQR